MVGYGTRRTWSGFTYRRTAGHTVRRIRYVCASPSATRALGRDEIRRELDSVRQERKFQALAEAHSLALYLGRTAPTLYEVCACKCGCIKIYAMVAQNYEER